MIAVDITRFKCEDEHHARALGWGGTHNILYAKNFSIVEGGSDAHNRKTLMRKDVDILMNPEKEHKKDTLHYPLSGLNHVLAKLAHDNTIAIGFGLSSLLEEPLLEERARTLRRMHHNIILCRKYRVRMVVCTYAKNKWGMRNKNDLLAFARILGMTGGESQQALSFKKKTPKIRYAEDTAH